MKKMLLFAVTIAALFSFPTLSSAQYPVLGTTADFAIFTTDGAVGGTTYSLITGNVGTQVGAITAFGNVNGVMHTADGATLQAAADLEIAYNDINDRTATDGHAALLGGGEILPPGVYDITGAAAFSGVLILDADDAADALFIIRISGGMNADISSQVVLARGALACNVFWEIDGVVNLFGGTMKGTIISQAAINMSPNTTLEGRVLTTAGAINVNQVEINIPIGCGSPELTGPDAPDMGTAADFSLFAGIGGVANDGETFLAGGVGSNSAGATGYEDDNVEGTIYVAPNNSTLAAKEDLLDAYTYLNGLVPDIQLLYPATFGYDLVLTPHTYLMSSAPTLTGTVFLDAQDNPDAVFVIKVEGQFSTATNSKVVLLNGAQAKNVYWKIDGAVSLGVNSEFAGTMVVNGAIDLLEGVDLAGRALTNNGAVSTAAIVATMYPDGTLPVTWVSFTGKAVSETVLLEWSTVNELNNGFFTIEKSLDGRRFEKLATVKAHGEIKNSMYNYSLTDQLPYSHGYYSISQTDKDGKSSFYKTIRVKANVNEHFKAIHYVQQSYMYVKASGAAPTNGSLKVYGMDGRLISSQTISLTKETSTYKIDKSLPKGIYLLNIESQGQRLYNKKVMVF